MTASTTSLPGGHAGAPEDPLGPLTGAAARLVAAAEELLAAPASELDPVSSLQRTEAVVRVRAVLRAVELDGVRDADTRELYALREAGSVQTWLGALPAAAGGGPRLALARRLAASPVAWSASARAEVAPVAVERVLAVVDRLPERPLQAVAAAHAGVLSTPDGRDLSPLEVKEAAERFTSVVTDGLRQVIGPVPDPHELDAVLDRLAAPTCTTLAEVRERLVDALLHVARRVHHRWLTPALRDLTDALLPAPDPDAPDPRHEQARLVLHEMLDGWGRVDGDLPPDAFRALRDDLHRRVAAHRARDAAQEQAQSDPPPDEEPEPGPPPAARRRPSGRELHEAFVEHVRNTTRDGSDTLSRPDGAEPAGAPGRSPSPSEGRPGRALSSVVITVCADRLTGQLGALPARTAHRHRVTDSALGAALCHAGITVLLTDARGATLDAASARRTATPAQWTAMTTTWGGLCADLGCGNPATVPHHVVPWHLGGDTSLHNQRPLCDRSHDDVHLGKRHLRLRDGSVIGPTGWVVPPPDWHART